MGKAGHELGKADIGYPLSARKRKSRDAGGTSRLCQERKSRCRWRSRPQHHKRTWTGSWQWER